MKNFFKNFIFSILRIQAKIVLWRHKPKVVAITGSVGKTSTKDSIASVLSNFYSVRRSQKSFNSEIGVPLTILDCPTGGNDPLIWLKNIWFGFGQIFAGKYPDWLVLEVGVDRPGDIKRTVGWLSSDIVVITKLGKTPAHVEFFENAEDVAEEKSKIINTLKPDGFLMLNYDDKDVLNLKSRSKNKVVTFGFDKKADIAASNADIEYSNDKPQGMSFKINHQGNSLPAKIDEALGRSHIYSFLSAMVCIYVLELNVLKSVEYLSKSKTPPGRMRIIKGVKETIIIDDSYNSSPSAASMALDTLREINPRGGKKIAVLGDMLELGDFSDREHRKLGEKAGAVADMVITVGQRSQFAVEGAKDAKLHKDSIVDFRNSDEAKRFVEKAINKGDIILIKGSQMMRMEKIVEEIMAEPMKKEELLVRQDKMWKDK